MSRCSRVNGAWSLMKGVMTPGTKCSVDYKFNESYCTQTDAPESSSLAGVQRSPIT
jgi:hypothetical protein